MLSSELPLHPPHDTARTTLVVLVASARRNEIAEAASTLRVLPFAGAMSGLHFTRDRVSPSGGYRTTTKRRLVGAARARSGRGDRGESPRGPVARARPHPHRAADRRSENGLRQRRNAAVVKY